MSFFAEEFGACLAFIWLCGSIIPIIFYGMSYTCPYDYVLCSNLINQDTKKDLCIDTQRIINNRDELCSVENYKDYYTCGINCINRNYTTNQIRADPQSFYIAIGFLVGPIILAIAANILISLYNITFPKKQAAPNQ